MLSLEFIVAGFTTELFVLSNREIESFPAFPSATSEFVEGVFDWMSILETPRCALRAVRRMIPLRSFPTAEFSRALFH